MLHCGLAVQIFPATMRTFTKYTALSEKGRGTACESAFSVQIDAGLDPAVPATHRPVAVLPLLT